jgi:phage tail sheath protein FI
MSVRPYHTPGVYIEEIPSGPRPIQSVGTSTMALVGAAPDRAARLNEPISITSWSRFLRVYAPEGTTSTPLSTAVYGFFQNGGRRCYVVNTGDAESIAGSGRERGGLAALEYVDDVSIVAAPGRTDVATYDALLEHCEQMRDRVAVLDAPREVDDLDRLIEVATVAAPARPASPAEGEEAAPTSRAERRGFRPRQSDYGYGAFYFPWIRVRDPLSNAIVDVPPSGHIGGIWARTDGLRGVHKAPANEIVRGALDIVYRLTDVEQGELNRNGVNCIRLFSRLGIRVWGARTVADPSSEWRYLNVRRLVCMIAESIEESTQWIVFEPNDYALWKSIRRDVTAFLTRVWRDGALFGRTPEEAFFVKCDEETNPPESIEAGMVVAVIGIAPVKPAEFVVFRITQHAAGSDFEVVGESRG